MKKLLSTLLALAMIMAMAPVAFAFSKGEVYVKEDDDSDYYDHDTTTLAPGETGYVYLGPYDDEDPQYDDEPRSIKITEQVIYEDGEDDDDDVKLITVEKKGEKKKIASGKYAWFAKIKVKSIKMSSYPENGYDVNDLEIEFTWADGTDGYTKVDLTFIGYEDADEELDEDIKMFTYEKEDDVDITLPDDDGTFTGVARKDFDILASMDTKVNNSLINKYPNADFRFYNGNGAKFPVTKGRLTIYGDSNEYCYEVNSNGEYVDLTDTYDSKEKGFVITTTTLGKYIISDMPLSGAVSSGNAAAPAPSAPAVSAPTTTYPVTSPIISNPNTGVWEG